MTFVARRRRSRVSADTGPHSRRRTRGLCRHDARYRRVTSAPDQPPFAASCADRARGMIAYPVRGALRVPWLGVYRLVADLHGFVEYAYQRTPLRGQEL